jgi:protein kinase-like protein
MLSAMPHPSPEPSQVPLQLSDSEWDARETSLLGREVERIAETASLGAAQAAEPSARLAAMTGFGPYRVVGTLGRGGMGAVFEVEHRELGVRYALKTILAPRGSVGFAGELERFRREAELSARLDHPGILRVHSASFEGSIPYLVVDLLSGGSLGERLDRGEVITPEEAVNYGLALARALAHAHERGVLHRDLKPDNVMLDEAGAPRLVDFGLALEPSRETRLTQSGVALGTPATMAPEQVMGERAESAATDVYGLGATLYWLLAGEPPLGTEVADMIQLVVMIMEKEPTPISEVRSDLPAPLVHLVTESLRKDSGVRPSLSDWIRVLSALGQGVELDLAGRRPGRGLALGAAGALLLAGAAAVTFSGQLGSAPNQSAAGATPSATSSADEVRWQGVLSGPKRARALTLFLADPSPVRADDLEAYAQLLSSAELEAEDLASLEERLTGLEDRGGAWALACVAAGELERARKHARRRSEVRSLVELELERARVDREKVMVRLSRNAMEAKDRDTDEVYASLLSSLRSWPAERVARLGPAARALAGRVLDRLQWTLGRAFLVRNLEKRFLGKGEDAAGGLSAIAAGPRCSGSGGLIFEIALRGAPEYRGRQECRELLSRAHAFEAELLADPGGRVLYASYALSYGGEPLEALRLGGLACNLGEREARSVDSYMNRFLPEMVARAVEAEWLGRDLARAERGRRAVEAYLRELWAVKRLRPRRTNVARITWLLSRGELSEAASVLREAEAITTSDRSYLAKLALLRAELDLAQDPLGAAQGVLDRLDQSEALFVEHCGLLAHARALLGLDAQEALREVERRRLEGLARLGLAWHAFGVAEVIDGQAWWPGQGAAASASRIKVR